MKEKSDYLINGFVIDYIFREKLFWVFELYYILKEILYELKN